MTLDRLWSELHRGRIYECAIRSPEWQIDGLSHGQDIYIDCRPAVLETLLHELLHRAQPGWSERRVTITAKRLMLGMDESTKRKWWRGYRRIRRIGTPVDAE